MEFMHSLTGFADLYPFGGNMGNFDEMDSSQGTHPSAYTKAAIGWLDPGTIAQHSGLTADYDLHAVGLVQPPPSGRVAAVQIGTEVPYLMVEARLRVDQFEANIPSEGVIVYEVQTTDPLGHAQNGTAPVQLLTPTALTVGQTYNAGTLEITVTSALPGGFSVHLTDPTLTTVPSVTEETPNIAQQRVSAAGLVAKFKGPNILHKSLVVAQSPLAGDVVSRGSTVTMTLSTGPFN